jgi:DNA invertase Pin-like site-specific DNA recombinase
MLPTAAATRRTWAMDESPQQQRRIAISYRRWSSAIQNTGDSERRQAEMAREWCTANGFELDDKRSIVDAGISAFRGQNLGDESKLAKLLEAVKLGDIPRHATILIEQFDRLSRAAASEALFMLQSIIREGLSVTTLIDGKTYDRASVAADPMSLMLALVTFIRSHDESASKQRRLRSVWQQKRDRAAVDGTPLSRVAPAWLKLSEDRKTWTVDEDKAAVVRRIYEMAADAVGHHKIAETLNRDAVPMFGRHMKDGTRRQGKHWHRAYVARLLEDASVIGRMTPQTVEYDEEGRKGRVVQAAIDGYYPAIVDPLLWSAVGALRAGKTPVSVKAGNTIQSMLAGLARCPLCHGSMLRVTKSKTYRYLVCSKARAGAGCVYHAVKQDAVEDTLRYHAERIIGEALTATTDAASVTLMDTLENVQAGLWATEDQIDTLVSELARRPSAAVRDRIGELEAVARKVRLERDELQGRISVTHGPVVEARLERLQVALIDGNAAAVNAALRQSVSNVVVDWRSGRLVFHWLHTDAETSAMFAWVED